MQVHIGQAGQINFAQQQVNVSIAGLDSDTVIGEDAARVCCPLIPIVRFLYRNRPTPAIHRQGRAAVPWTGRGVTWAFILARTFFLTKARRQETRYGVWFVFSLTKGLEDDYEGSPASCGGRLCVDLPSRDRPHEPGISPPKRSETTHRFLRGTKIFYRKRKNLSICPLARSGPAKRHKRIRVQPRPDWP